MDDLPTFFATLAETWFEGDLDELAEVFVHPLPIYTRDRLRIEATPEETKASVSERRRKAVCAGAVHILTRIVGLGPEQDGRLPVLVEWRFLDEMDRTIDRSEIRYYCRDTGSGGLRIEMIEFEVLAFRGH